MRHWLVLLFHEYFLRVKIKVFINVIIAPLVKIRQELMNANVTKDLSTKTVCVEMSTSVQTLLTAVINTLSA